MRSGKDEWKQREEKPAKVSLNRCSSYYWLANHMTDNLFLSGANRAGAAQTQSQSLNLSAIWEVVSAEVSGTISTSRHVWAALHAQRQPFCFWASTTEMHLLVLTNHLAASFRDLISEDPCDTAARKPHIAQVGLSFSLQTLPCQSSPYNYTT